MINNNKGLALSLSKGFTLIEVIVVLAVFLFVIGVAIGIFISIIQQQRAILSEEEILNQVSYVEEFMSKALRMAARDPDGSCLGTGYENYNYRLMPPKDATGTYYQGIKFINQSDNNACTEFYLDTDNTLKEVKNSVTTALTSNKLNIENIKFAINGVTGGACIGCVTGAPGNTPGSPPLQPEITIVIKVKIQGNTSEPERIIQTTVSQRNLNAAQ